MTKFRSAIPAAALLLTAGAAQATVVTETFVGTIKGADVKDTDGLFGPAGASLAGQTITIKTRYDTALLPTAGVCRTGPACTYDESQKAPTSVTSTFTVGGVTVSYVAEVIGAVFFQNNYQNRFSAETNSFSGQNEATHGSAVSVSFTNPVAFGKQLSPANKVVPNRPDFASFFKAGDDQASETLSFVVTQATP